MNNPFSRLGRLLILLGCTIILPALGVTTVSAAPVVNSFSPASGLVGTSVAITGTSFTNITSVTFNNVAASFTVNSSSSITATVPAGASSGRIRVIATPGGTGVSGTNFTVTQPPTITSFTPTARVGETVTVTGQRLSNASVVTLNGTAVAFSQISATRVSFVVPNGATTGFITVTTPDGTATSPNEFVVRPNQPTITSFTPTSGAGGVTLVIISGTDLLTTSEVRFGTTASGNFTVVSNTRIDAIVPVGASSGRIRVITAGGTGLSTTNFTVVGAPTITTFTPTTAAVGSSVLISGTNFVNVASVRFNGTAATSFTVVNRNRLRVTVPAGATSGNITVTTPSGTATSPTPFTLNLSAPTISSFTPTSGNAATTSPVAAGNNVTINGANFLGTAGSGVSNTQVYFNGVQATTVTFVNSGQIRARVPVGATTGPITVTTANGSGLSVNNFTVNNAPTNTAPTITGTVTQRGCANSQLAISYTVNDAQTAADDLTVTGTSPGNGSVITFVADNNGTGATRTALVDAVDAAAGGSTTLTLTVTDASNATGTITFNITLDAVVMVSAGPDQTVAAGQAVALEGMTTGAASTQWTTSGSGSFDNAGAAATNYNPSQADYLTGSVVLTLTGSPAMGSGCPSAADALVVSFTRPDRIVTGTETLTGIFNNVLVVSGARLTVGSGLDVSGLLDIQAGATLAGGATCAPITGTGSFSLEDGARIEICDPQGIMVGGVIGQVRLTGSVSYGAGAEYAYVGSGSQNSGSGLPLNLTGSVTVDNGGAGVNLTNNLNLRGELHLLNGDLRLVEVSFRVISDASGTGVVDNQNGAVIGTATVQRYIEGSLSTAVGYHHLSSPVMMAPVSDLNTAGFTAVVNPAYNPPANPAAVRPYPNVFGFDERRAPTSATFTRGYFSPDNLSSTLEPGRGYSVYINGGSTPDFVGTLTTGNVARTGLTRTGNFTAAGQKSGWHLLGNPYPSPIDWDRVTVPTGLSPIAFVWRSTGGTDGSYVAYENGTGAANTDLIGLGQGIFVRVTANTSVTPISFTFTNACRVTTNDVNAPVYRTTAATRPQLALGLRAAAATTEAAVTTVYFQDGATAAIDAAFDGARPGRNVGAPTLATVVAEEELAVNALAPAALATGVQLPLLVDVPAAGTYELAVQDLTDLAGTEVYLLDALTGTAQPLTTDTRYTFTAPTAGEQTARFALRFGAATGAASADALTVWPNPATGRAQVRLSNAAGRLTLVDALGRTVRTQTLAADQTAATLDLAGLPAGVYTVRAGASTTRLVVE